MVKTRISILYLLILLTACSPITAIRPARVPVQRTPERGSLVTPVARTLQAQLSTPVVGKATAGTVTTVSIAIEREEGSSAVCTPNATYFVHASIITNGPVAASYEISSTAGQIAAGNFEDLNTQTRSPIVSGKLIFDQADTKTINLRFIGPYPYPGDITVVLRVNGGELHNAKLFCQG